MILRCTWWLLSAVTAEDDEGALGRVRTSSAAAGEGCALYLVSRCLFGRV